MSGPVQPCSNTSVWPGAALSILTISASQFLSTTVLSSCQEQTSFCRRSKYKASRQRSWWCVPCDHCTTYSNTVADLCRPGSTTAVFWRTSWSATTDRHLAPLKSQALKYCTLNVVRIDNCATGNAVSFGLRRLKLKGLILRVLTFSFLTKCSFLLRTFPVVSSFSERPFSVGWTTVTACWSDFRDMSRQPWKFNVNCLSF